MRDIRKMSTMIYIPKDRLSYNGDVEMIKLVRYLQNFDDVYNELRWHDGAKKVLDEIRNCGIFTQELAFETIEMHLCEASLKDLRTFVTDELLDRVNSEKRILREWFDDFNRCEDEQEG